MRPVGPNPMHVVLTEHTELPKILGLSIWTNKELNPQLAKFANHHDCDYKYWILDRQYIYNKH